MIRTMNFLRKTLFLLLAISLAVVALLAGADNSDEVSLKFLEWESMSLPVSAWILMAFVIGVLFGTALNLMTNTRLRMNARAANKTAANRTRELDQARAEQTTEPLSEPVSGPGA